MDSYKLIRTLLIIFLIFNPINSKTDEITHHGTVFYIAKEVQSEQSNLIKLILNTESMDDDERQYWFDIMPSMTKKQIDRLNEILAVEKKKLEELEVKYQKEIKSLNEKHLVEWKEFTKNKSIKKINKKIEMVKGIKKSNLYYLAYNENNIPKIKVTRILNNKLDDIYIPDDSDKFTKYENMIILEFGKKIIENIDKNKALYDDIVFKGYIKIITNSAVILNDSSTLNSIYKNELANKESIISSMYIAREDYESLANLYNKDIKTENWNKNIFIKLLNLTKWRRQKGCNNKCEEVLVSLFDKMLKEDYPFKYKDIKEYFDEQLIILDIVRYFNKDIINKRLDNKIENFIQKYYLIEKSYHKTDQEWYVKLNKSYFSGNIDRLYDLTKSKYISSDDFNSIEGNMLEVSTYTAFSKIKNNKEDEALKILLSSKRLGESVYSSAYNYLEKDLVDFLIEVSSAPQKFKKGHVNLGVFKVKGNNKEFKPFGKKYAIIVGISDYKNLSSSENTANGNLHDLKYADEDAKAFNKFLNTPRKSGGGWEVSNFIGNDADMISVRKKIDAVLSKAKENDLIYIFFSGHARLNPNNNEEVYLLTQDFSPGNPYSGIPYNWLISTINRSSTKHLITFIDACRSGTIKNSKGSSNVDQGLLNNVVTHSPTKVIFTSGSGSQISYEDDKFEKGIFTHFLLKGLYGDAKDINHDGFVNLNELEDFTSNNVSKYTLESKDITYQRPRVSNLDPTFSVQFPLSIR